MPTPLFVWIIVAIVCTLAVFYKIMGSLHHHKKNSRITRINRIIEIGRESEEFFVPGDRIIKNDFDYDD